MRCFTRCSPARTPLALWWFSFWFRAVEYALPNSGRHFAPRPLTLFWVGLLAFRHLFAGAIAPGGMSTDDAAVAAAVTPALGRYWSPASDAAADYHWLVRRALLGRFLVELRHSWRTLCERHFLRRRLSAVATRCCSPCRAAHSAAFPGHEVHSACQSGDAI